MYILNILSAVKKMIVKEVKYFIFQNYYGRIGFTKKNSCHSIKHQKKKYLLATKSIKKISHASNANYSTTKTYRKPKQH